MRNLTPGYEMDSFSDGIAPWAGGRIDSQWQYNNTTSWFVPDKMGDHDIKWGGTYHQAFIEDFRESYLGGQFHFNTDRPFDIDDYSTYPERLRIRVGKENGRQFDYPSTRGRCSCRTSGRGTNAGRWGSASGGTPRC